MWTLSFSILKRTMARGWGGGGRVNCERVEAMFNQELTPPEPRPNLILFDLLHCYKKFIHAAGDHHWSRQNIRLVRTSSVSNHLPADTSRSLRLVIHLIVAHLLPVVTGNPSLVPTFCSPSKQDTGIYVCCCPPVDLCNRKFFCWLPTCWLLLLGILLLATHPCWPL